MLLEGLTQAELNEVYLEGKITTLTIKKCKISYIPKHLLPYTLIRLRINGTRLKDIDSDLFNLPNLEELNLYDNQIENVNFIIAPKLTELDLSYNCIENVNINVNKLERINLDCNKMSVFPTCLMKANLLINIGHNNFMTRNGQVHQKAFEPVNNMLDDDEKRSDTVNVGETIKSVYKNNYKLNNNVHSKNIKSDINDSIKKLLKKYYKYDPKYYSELKTYYYNERCDGKNIFVKMYYKIVDDDITTEIKKLRKSNYTYIYDVENYLSIDYNELLQKIWAFAKESEWKTDIMTNLKIQILEGVDFCHAGKISRIVNSIAGFTDLVTYEQPLNVRLANKIKEIKDYYTKVYDPSSHMYITSCIKDFRKYMDELKISQEEQTVWLEPLYDCIEGDPVEKKDEYLGDELPNYEDVTLC